MVPLDLAIQAYSRDTLVHLGGTVAANVFLLFGRERRKEWVTAQFATGQQVMEYEDPQAIAHVDSRFRAARIALMHELLAEFPEGELLDAGCGPGMLVRSLLDSPAHDYRITMLDQSEAMIRYCAAHTDGSKSRAVVGDLENLPFGDGAFDVTVSTGVLEYTDASAALRQLFRVTKPGGAVVVSMLNPSSPYWVTDWFLYRPTVRALASAMTFLRIPHRRYEAASHNGIRALRPRVLYRYLRQAGLVPADAVYFAFTPLIRPLDRVTALRRWAERHGGKLPAARGWRRWMATGYIIVAHRPG